MVLASVAILFAVSRTTPSAGAPSPVPEPPAMSATAPTPTPPPSAEPFASPTPSTTAAPTTSAKKATTKPSTRPVTSAGPAAPPPPVVSPSAAGPKKPPANPYGRSGSVSEFVLDETERMAGSTKPVRRLAIVLTVLEGPQKGLRVKIDGPRATIGSAEGSTLRLLDRAVSRIHCELEPGSKAIALRDLGSTNGTFASDVRVRDGDVAVGTILRCGGSVVRIDAADEPSFVELSERTSFGELVGASLEMRRVYATLERVALSDTTLLVQGETGTGKDVAARSVHSTSIRGKGPFVPVDCGAIPETLFESELFGHVRGAFTGAVNNRAGAFEEANGGTLFLDEIGEMPVAMQAKLLRAIETRRVRRVGATRETDVDVRIIGATNRRLAEMVNDGTFREDLYYRLAVVEIVLPPLRARREDIPPSPRTSTARSRAKRIRRRAPSSTA